MPDESSVSGLDKLMAKVRAVRALENARHHFENGHFALVELILRDFTADGPEAIEAAEIRDRALKNLNISMQPLNTNARRFLVIREWMFGFWSDVDHVLGACLTAEAAGRIPVVHWGSQSRFSSPNDENGWRLYFEPVSDATIEDAQGGANSLFPAKWKRESLSGMIAERSVGPEAGCCALELLARREDVIVSDIHCSISEILPFLHDGHPCAGKHVAEARRVAVDRYLRPTPQIRSKVDEFVDRHFGPGPVLGVHFRDLDKFLEDPELEQINARYPAMIERELNNDPQLKIFLLTDCASFADSCKEKYGDRIVTTSAHRADGKIGLHHMDGWPDRSRLGFEVLLDTLLAARCDKFIGLASSNVSVFVRDLKNWLPGTCILQGTVRADHPNTHTKTHAYPPREI